MAGQQETSMRDDLDAAIDAEETEQPEIEEQYEEGREAAQETEKEEVSEEKGREEQEVSAGAPVKSAKTPKGTTPPVDWSPTVKDKWKDLPPEVQQAIAKRERDVNVTLEHTTSARRISENFIKTIEPYRAIMAAEGVNDPMVAINGLLSTAAQLQVGNPQQKAKRIADLIKHYGVDIETLDSVLAGEQLPQGQQQAPSNDPRIDQIWQRMQQAEQQQQQHVRQQAYSSIGEFAQDQQNEFFEYVRVKMADNLDMARINNQTMTLKEAYDAACWSNPEIRDILVKRQTYGGKGMMQQKKNAASSISGRRSSGSDVSDPDNMSMRDLIAAQFGDTGRI